MSVQSGDFSFADILYEKKAGVAWITINRPETYNSLVRSSILELTAAIGDAADDNSIGVIVLTGAGEKSFCSGGNVKDMSQRTGAVKRRHLHSMAHLAIAMRTSGKPIIAAVNGYAIGLGHELHVMCDLTIAADHAKFGQTGPKVGSVPIWGITETLPRVIGEKRAREMIYLCRQYTAQQALAMGLVNAVVPMSELYATVDQWAQELLDKSPQCLRIAKLAINQDSDQGLWAGMFAGSELISMHVDGEEYREGTHAFVEKRKPDFRKYRR
jgi:dihydroxynaphthoic acid synthetase